MTLPKLLITDIDGVWTDGGMYYDNLGNEWKKFNTSDSAGVLFLKILEIPLAIITGEDTEILRRRAQKLKVDYLYMGIRDKIGVARRLCQEMGISLKEAAYIGDDINDILLFNEVGYSGSPSNAPDYIKKITNVVIDKKGGEGAFRAFIEHILVENNLMDTVLKKYLDDGSKFNQ